MSSLRVGVKKNYFWACPQVLKHTILRKRKKVHNYTKSFQNAYLSNIRAFCIFFSLKKHSGSSSGKVDTLKDPGSLDFLSKIPCEIHNKSLYTSASWIFNKEVPVRKNFLATGFFPIFIDTLPNGKTHKITRIII